MPYIYNRKDVTDTIGLLSSRLCDLADKELRFKKYREKCEEDIDEKVSEITTVIETLESDLKQRNIKGDITLCLDNEAIQCLIEKGKGLSGVNCKPYIPKLIQTNEDNLEEWTLKNPRCVSYQDWQKASYYFCDDVDLKLSIPKEDICDLVLELITESISCDIILAAKVFKEEKKKIDLKLSVDKQQCKVEFKLLHEKIPNCNIDLKTYIELTECNVTFDVIRTVYEHNNLELKVHKGTVMLKTPLNKYPLEQLSNADIDSIKKYI